MSDKVSDEQTKTHPSRSVETARGEPAAAWDELSGPGTSGRQAGTNEAGTNEAGTSAGADRATPASSRSPTWLLYGLVASGVAAICAVNAVSLDADIIRFGGRPPAFWKPLLWEFSSGLVILLLLPLVRHTVRRSQLADRPLAYTLLMQAGFAGAFSVLHVLGMVALRKLAYAAFDLGAYAFAFSSANLLYEARKDVVTYLVIASVFWLADRRRPGAGSKVPAPAGAAERPDTLWLRDGTTSVRIRPAEIAWVASAGNYVEYCMADGRRHLIRATLANEEGRLAAFAIIRVHRTRLINARRIRRLTTVSSGNLEIELDTGEVVTGSRRYRAGLDGIQGA